MARWKSQGSILKHYWTEAATLGSELRRKRASDSELRSKRVIGMRTDSGILESERGVSPCLCAVSVKGMIVWLGSTRGIAHGRCWDDGKHHHAQQTTTRRQLTEGIEYTQGTEWWSEWWNAVGMWIWLLSPQNRILTQLPVQSNALLRTQKHD